MNFGIIRKYGTFGVIALFAVMAPNLFAQDRRPRIVTIPAQPPTTIAKTTQPTRPGLSQPIIVGRQSGSTAKLVKKTVMSAPIGEKPYGIPSVIDSADVDRKLLNAIHARLGIRYRYGSNGPNSYDCSGLVWSVFRDAGISFDRTSALMFWRNFEPVSGDERYEFGTLVFFNKLGHVGIVANETGFYHASSSKGVTFSPFTGYWEKRIVGFRRIPKKNV